MKHRYPHASELIGLQLPGDKLARTANFLHAEVDVADDVPADIETRDFAASGIIIADICASAPRTLSILAVEG